MYCIVPLAGPDFFIEKLNILKPLIKIEGVPLFEMALKSREWFQSFKNNDFIFVVRDTPYTPDFISYVRKTFPGSKSVVVSSLTRGALLTVVAAVSLVEDFTVPVCVDLVDIIYESSGLSDINSIFEEHLNCGGVLPFFKSDYEKYSYLKIKNGLVIQTAEKKVISNNASAGTYWFRNLPALLMAISNSIKLDKFYEVNGSLFVCPLYNELIGVGFDVLPIEVKLQKCLSSIIHEL